MIRLTIHVLYIIHQIRLLFLVSEIHGPWYQTVHTHLDLHTIVDVFDFAEPDERLELLIDYGSKLPPLSPEYAVLRDTGAFIVHECQAPVFFMVEFKGGRLHIEVDAPAEAAIARGFSALLKELFHEKIIPGKDEVPENMLEALQIEGLLGMQRRRGLGAIYRKLTDQLST